ncbi:T9SS type A sorting domain-containing protein [Chryseobacterium gallinarum]|uniref:T9SS type A sorting domain-containing protein n=1 Tax=Chryseobacterium gallinarum TaxID=1324352 RepID=UPI002023CB39|nr:T9SS type A sorting domain-containing protein [Chryseobacterium gallinarum]MCL8538470.1 T9SS type A sorting domain-containing protein [Chryseobacterium gallinarum]
MKKTFLFVLMTFFMSCGTLSAQLDYIFMLDNGGSLDKSEYLVMRRGAIKLMEQLIACNPENRVAVVQYGTGVFDNDTGVYKPLIYIESDFTNDFFTAQNFERRLDFGDYFQQSMGLVGDALDGIPNPDIISPQKTLNSLQQTRVVVFTDAERASTGLNSYLVNPSFAANYGSYEAFANVMDFKINRGIRFTVIHANTNNDAILAAASIASPNGSYTGPLETVAQDPSNGHARSYFNRTNGFHMMAGETNYWKDLAETICVSSDRNIDFLYEPGQCIHATSDLQGYYHLPAGITLKELKLDLINLQTGAVYPVNAYPVLSGNFFTFNFVTYSFDDALSAGSTGPHKFRLTMIDSYGNVAYSWNKYPYFDFDIDMSCQTPLNARSSVEEKFITLTPNPTHGLFKAILNKEITSGTLEVSDMTGNTVFNKIVRGEKEIEIDLTARKEGVYMVRVTTDKNEIYSEKVIKK